MYKKVDKNEFSFIAGMSLICREQLSNAYKHEKYTKLHLGEIES